MIGIINLNKPQGKTSHDMVYFIRRTLNIKQVGHTGTLDPDATGVLPVLVGKATRLSDFLVSDTKEYIARIRLGIETDTEDITGSVIKKSDVDLNIDDVKKVLSAFEGEINQLPPMYSAVKINGKKLYTLARKGITVERKPRKITIYKILLLSDKLENNEFEIKVSCSKGTYIRTLCADIGKALGCGAAMAALERTKSGNFAIENSFTPEEIEELAQKGDFASFIMKIDDVLGAYKKACAAGENEKKVKNGIRLRPSQLGIKSAQLGEIFRIYDEEENLICLSEVIFENETLVLKHLKSFY